MVRSGGGRGAESTAANGNLFESNSNRDSEKRIEESLKEKNGFNLNKAGTCVPKRTKVMN